MACILWKPQTPTKLATPVSLQLKPKDFSKVTIREAVPWIGCHCLARHQSCQFSVFRSSCNRNGGGYPEQDTIGRLHTPLANPTSESKSGIRVRKIHGTSKSKLTTWHGWVRTRSRCDGTCNWSSSSLKFPPTMPMPLGWSCTQAWTPGSRRYDLHVKKELVMEFVGLTREPPSETPGCKRKHFEDHLLNTGHHFPEKGEGKDHHCMVCVGKCRRIKWHWDNDLL